MYFIWQCYKWSCFLKISDCSLLAYGITADFFFLMFLCPATLLNLFISSNSFFVDSSYFLYIKSFQNRDSFISSFPIWMRFLSFSCLITLATISYTMLNRSGKKEHPGLVLDLTGRAFGLWPLTVGLFRRHLFSGRGSSFLFLLCGVFLLRQGVSLPNAFSAFLKIIIWFCPLFF